MIKTVRVPLLFLTVALVSAFPGFAQKRAPSKPQKALLPREIVSKVMPSVVIVVTQDNQGEMLAQGSGFSYKPGLIVTNLHVLKRASKAFVRVVGKEINYKVTRVVSIDARHDLCVLRIDEKVLPPMVVDAIGKPAIGDEVFAFGNPKGLEGSVSKGIISGIRSDLGLLQVDAAISPGSSGGPLVNDRGELIGISVSSLVSGQNLNFAVPVSFLTKMSEQQFVNDTWKEVDKILGMPSSFGVSVGAAGRVAVNDRDAAFLRGNVKSVKSEFAFFEYDEKSDKYFEEARKSNGREVFDELGNLTEDWNYNYGDLAWKYFYSYDESGLRTKVVWEPGAGTERKREVYQYSAEDAAYRRGEVDRITSTGVFEDTKGKIVYDALGNVKESVIKEFGIRWVNTFDEDGLVLEQKLYESDKFSKTLRYSYEFDRRGNWIKQTKTELNSKYPSLGFTPVSVIYREITYF